MSLIAGHYFENFKSESFIDNETSRIRVILCSGRHVPRNLVFECSKKEKESHPVKTAFTTRNENVSQKPDGRIYLRTKDQFIKKYSAQ